MSESDCGLSSEATLTDALRYPLASGVKVTVMEQLVPGGTDVPQLLVWTKSRLLVPMTRMDVMAKASLPAFINVEACGLPTKPTG